MKLRQTTILFAAAVVLASCDDTRREMHFPSSSMEPTIKAGSNVIVDTQAYDQRDPERFDIVLFSPPHLPEERFAFTVIGLPGESIKLDGKGLRVDGAEIKHPHGVEYIAADETVQRAPVKGIEIRSEASLGPDQYFVLGDNDALDSRYFGPITRAAIHGKIIKIEQDSARQPATRPESKAE